MASARTSSALGGWSADAAALFLVAATPFVSYLAHHGFPLARPVVGLLLLALLATCCLVALLVALAPSSLRPAVYAAGVVLFVDFQFDLLDWRLGLALGVFLAALALCKLLGARCAPVFLAAFGVMFAVTAAGGGASRTAGVASAEVRQGASGSGPPILHVILDEHAGLAGLPLDVPGGAEARRSIVEFLSRNGFRFFGRAYSRFMDSDKSLNALFNFSRESSKTRDATSSRYARILADRGYDVTIIQSTYMSFCRPGGSKAEGCFTYDYQDLGLLDEWDVSTAETAMFLVMNYLDLSYLHMRALAFYGPPLMRLENALELPGGHVENKRINSLAGFVALDKTIKLAGALRPGNALIAHILLPHFPYAFDRSCELRTPLWAWKSRGPWLLGRLAPNDAASRDVRYGEYIDQLACVYAKLEELLDAVDRAGLRDDAIVIVNGDHGARIIEGAVEANLEALPRMRQQDFLDAFSTLFAVRMPGLPPGHDERMLPIEELLRRTMEEPGLLSDRAAGDDELSPAVRIRDRKDGSYRSIPIQAFPSLGGTAQPRRRGEPAAAGVRRRGPRTGR